MTYTEKELDQFLHGISLSLLSKKSAQHWRYDEETAKEIEWLEVLERKVRADKADRKTEPTCDTCRHKGVEGCEQPCLGCGCCGLYEAMTGNDKLKEKVVEFIKSCARCKHRPIGAMMCKESCRYEPKTEPQTEREGE